MAIIHVFGKLGSYGVLFFSDYLCKVALIKFSQKLYSLAGWLYGWSLLLIQKIKHLQFMSLCRYLSSKIQQGLVQCSFSCSSFSSNAISKKVFCKRTKVFLRNNFPRFTRQDPAIVRIFTLYVKEVPQIFYLLGIKCMPL